MTDSLCRKQKLADSFIPCVLWSTLIVTDCLSEAKSDALLCNAISSAYDLRARGSRFNIQSGHIVSFPLPLILEGQLSVIGKSICT